MARCRNAGMAVPFHDFLADFDWEIIGGQIFILTFEAPRVGARNNMA
jgi:hypothetical protein